jgi:hypothetical protein
MRSLGTLFLCQPPRCNPGENTSDMEHIAAHVIAKPKVRPAGRVSLTTGVVRRELDSVRLRLMQKMQLRAATTAARPSEECRTDCSSLRDNPPIPWRPRRQSRPSDLPFRNLRHNRPAGPKTADRSRPMAFLFVLWQICCGRPIAVPPISSVPPNHHVARRLCPVRRPNCWP